MKELSLEQLQDRRRASERAQLIHAVIDGQARGQLACEFQRHGGIEPVDRRANVVPLMQLLEQLALTAAGLRAPDQARGDQIQLGRGKSNLELTALAGDARALAFHPERLFDEEHAPIAGALDHQVVGALKHEVPTEVGEAQYVCHFASLVR